MPTKKDTADVLLRLPKAMIDKIDELRKTADGFPSRQDVIRQILEERLGAVGNDNIADGQD